MANINPQDAQVKQPLELSFGRPESYRALTRLAETTLGKQPLIQHFEDGLTVLLGKAGADFVFGVIYFFDKGRLNAFIEHFGVEGNAERNLRAFMARWAPIINSHVNPEGIRLFDVTAAIGPDGWSQYQFLFRTNTEEIRCRFTRDAVFTLIHQVLRAMDRAKALPDGIGPELIERLGRMRRGHDEQTDQ